jgi:YD repeat-containing protein
MKLTAYVGFTLCFVLLAQASPVDLSTPLNTLGAADKFGHLRIWRELDNVDLGQGVTLPLRVEFNSGQQTSSPYLGEGWSCPLLDSNVFLQNKLLMQVTLLCGKIMYLERDKANMHIYHTPDMEWTGTVRGNTTVISRSDGWALTYWNGHILKMRTDTGRLFRWVTSGNTVTAIQEDGVQGPAPFQVAMTADGVPDGFYVNGKLYSFALEKRPRVVQDGAIRAIASLDPTLGSMTWPDKSKEAYAFAVDTSTLTPNFQITDRAGKQNIYSWDPATGDILSDGVWHYEVGPTENDLDEPRISRQNDKGQEEFIAIDRNTGITESKTISGGHEISEKFISPGPLYGKVHKIESVDDKGNEKLIYQAGYDELGRLLRETGPDGFTTAYILNSDGRIVQQTVMPPTDLAILAQWQKKEESLLDAVAQAKTRVQKSTALEALAFFYIGKMGSPDKALALVTKVTNPQQAFNIQLYAIGGNRALTPQEKADRFQALLKSYPQRQTLLTRLINNEQMKATNENHA